MQVYLVKSKMKPPGIKGLKVKCNIPLSTSAFKFNLRCYSMETHSKREATQIVDGLEGGGGRLDMRQVRIVLRPSVAVVEVGPAYFTIFRVPACMLALKSFTEDHGRSLVRLLTPREFGTHRHAHSSDSWVRVSRLK